MSIAPEGKLISVVMPVFNAGSYLHEAIESILKQTYKNVEFIIVNDGSTDDSEKTISSFSDKRIIVLKNEKNEGIISCLNKAIQIAKGDYIARMDADDIAMPDRLQSQEEKFRKNTKLIVCGTDYYSLNNGKKFLVANFDDSEYQKTILLFSTCFAHPTVMMKNIFREKEIKYNSKFIHAEDYKLWTDLALLGKFENVGRPMLRYRSHPSQVSNAHNEAQLKISAEIRKEYLDKLGFRYNDDQFKIHNIIGDNIFITSKNTLIEIEKWLLELINQNKKIKVLNENSFLFAIQKFWFDSCGFTNLGLYSFFKFRKSEINIGENISISRQAKLLSKCLLRAFRKK